MYSDKVRFILEKLDNKVEALRVDYYDRSLNEADLYYFYYNQNNDPCVVSCPVGGKITEESIAISLPSAVHMDLDFRKSSSITESEITQVIKAYKILTENVLKKNVQDGKVIRKRVTTIEKPKRVYPLVNRVKNKKGGLFAQTAVARVKRNRSNNTRNILNLNKQPKKDKSVLDFVETKENTMQRQEMTRRFTRVNETYCTYPQARSIAVNIVDALAKHKIEGYPIKYPQTALGQVDQRGFSINYGMTNRKFVAREFLEDAIAKDIMGRYARGEEIDANVKNQLAM